MEKTIRFALELEPDLAHFLIAAPYPGTRLWEMLHEEGAEIFSHDWGDLAIQDDKAHFQMGEMTAELVERKWHEAYRRFYLRPGRLLRRLLQWDTWRCAPERLRDARRLFLNGRKQHASVASPQTPEWSGKAARRLG